MLYHPSSCTAGCADAFFAIARAPSLIESATGKILALVSKLVRSQRNRRLTSERTLLQRGVLQRRSATPRSTAP